MNQFILILLKIIPSRRANEWWILRLIKKYTMYIRSISIVSKNYSMKWYNYNLNLGKL